MRQETAETMRQWTLKRVRSETKYALAKAVVWSIEGGYTWNEQPLFQRPLFAREFWRIVPCAAAIKDAEWILKATRTWRPTIFEVYLNRAGQSANYIQFQRWCLAIQRNSWDNPWDDYLMKTVGLSFEQFGGSVIVPCAPRCATWERLDYRMYVREAKTPKDLLGAAMFDRRALQLERA